MPSKATKKVRRAGSKKKVNEPAQIPDDGTRWILRNKETNHRVYGGAGITRHEAERLARTMTHPTYLEEVDGT